jgi:23S rRNA (uracil1939-C5)-methyltransferase
VWWTAKGDARRLVFARGEERLRGASFTQVNDAVSLELHAFVLHQTLSFNPSSVVDAYCGSGSVALALAQHARVTAIESDSEAVAAFSGLLPEGSSAVCGLVERVLPSLPAVDVVLLNPPRSGLHISVANTLASGTTARKGIIYVSCDAGTLARDLGRLPGYRLQSVDCFDMFPQTSHVETVVVLTPVEGT